SSSKADQANPRGTTFLLKFPKFAVAKEDKNNSHPRISCESNDTAVDQPCSVIEPEKPATQNASAVVKPAEPCDTARKYSRYRTKIDCRLKRYLNYERVCAINPYTSTFWQTEGAYKARLDAVEWMSRISGSTYADREALHLGINYLEMFLDKFIRPIHTGLKPYALACLYMAKVFVEGNPHVEVGFPPGDKDMLQTKEFDMALNKVVKTLFLWVKMVKDVDGKTFVKTFDLPTTVNFLVLAFQRAAIELPEQFTEEQQLEQQPEQQRNGQQGESAREIAIGPFAEAFRLATILLCDQDSLLFRWSELAAACFFIATQPSGIDSGVFLKCTGYTLESVKPAIVYARAVCQGFQ
ncbi:hypothetical protein LPJ57_003352, partial [Coemansia sp. RSA 486]